MNMNEKGMDGFVDAVNSFMKNFPEDTLLAVHCTHGVNRTGYVICRYLVEVLGFDPEVAIKEFAASRGHPIQREAYINDIYKRHRTRVLERYTEATHLAVTESVPSTSQPGPNFRTEQEFLFRAQESSLRTQPEYSRGARQGSSFRGRKHSYTEGYSTNRRSFRNFRKGESLRRGNRKGLRPNMIRLPPRQHFGQSLQSGLR